MSKTSIVLCLFSREPKNKVEAERQNPEASVVVSKFEILIHALRVTVTGLWLPDKLVDGTTSATNVCRYEELGR
jgi:hypothetical protein